MRMRVMAALVSGLVACATVVAVGPPAVAAVKPGVVSVSVDPGPFAVDGVRRTAATAIRIHVVEPRGDGAGSCGGCDGWASYAVRATFARTAGGPRATAYVLLRLASGTRNDGTWAGTWHLGATHGGTWTLVQVVWAVNLDQGEDVDPRVAPGVRATVTVRATHVPTVAVTRIPSIAAFGARQWIRLAYGNGYGRPLASYPVTYGWETDCSDVGGAGTRVRLTDTQGALTIRLYARYTAQECLILTAPGLGTPGRPPTRSLDDVALLRLDWLYRYERYRSVGITAPRVTVHAGRSVTVSGTAYPAWGTTLQLQQWNGRSWRLLSARAASPAHEGYTTAHAALPWRPTAAGTARLRVVAVGGHGAGSVYAPTASRAITVTVVR